MRGRRWGNVGLVAVATAIVLAAHSVTGVQPVDHREPAPTGSEPGASTMASSAPAATAEAAEAATIEPTLAEPPEPPEPPECAAPLVCGDDLDAALALEERIADNIWYGQVLEIDYRTPERLRGDVASVGAWGDSGLWTGVYLAAESYRYAVAHDKLAGGDLDPTGTEFWVAQQAEAKARVDELVAKYHLNINIARGWRTELDPQVDPSTPSVRYGGGIVQGEEGMLMRSCAPVDAPLDRAMARNRRVFGPFRWEDDRDYVCETAPSRDTYAGTTFGLLTAFDLVGPDDPALQRLIADDVRKLGEFLLEHGWSYPRPHGNVNVPVGEQENPITGERLPLFGHDFDGVLSPLFVYVPSARLSMTQSVRHVTAVAGPAEAALTWEAVWAEELASQGPLLAGSMEVDAAEPNASYYKFNLNHLTMFNLTRLEHDPVLRSLFVQAFGVMDHTTGDDGNAHFEAITHAVTAELSRFDDAVAHLRDWRDYRHNIHLGPVDNSPGCGVEFECVPEDQLDGVVAGQTVVLRPGTAGRQRARVPLPVANRPPTDFLWQRPSTQLAGAEGPTHQAPGIDYLTPYWMLRYYSEVAAPLGVPFPAWPGPSHR